MITPKGSGDAADTLSVIDALPRAIVLTDAAGSITAWNRVAERLTGWRPDDVIATSLADLVPSDFREAIGTILASDEPCSWRGPLEFRHASGGTAQLFATAGAIRDASRRKIGTLVAADDFAEIDGLELRASELADHLHLALEAGELGTWRWNRVTDEVIWDEAMEVRFGLEPGAFGGTFDDWVGLLLPSEVGDVLSALEAAIEKKDRFQVDHRVELADGSIRWLHGRGMITCDAAGEVTGAIGCISDITERKRAELEAELRADLATTLADLERTARERLEFLNALSDAALTARTHRHFMDKAADVVVPRLGDWCGITFLPEDGGEREVSISHVDAGKVAWMREMAEAHPFDPDGSSGLARVVRTGTPEIISDVAEVSAALIQEASAASGVDVDDVRNVLDALQLTSLITMPLTTNRRILGAVQFATAESGRHFDDNDVALARIAASRIAEGIDNMWFVARERMIARTLQRALLPPALPDVSGLELAARYWPGGAGIEVGGDFYDAFTTSDGSLAITVGDICGRGPDAAALTGMARHTIRAAATHGQDPVGVLGWLNEAFLRSNRDRFCTSVVCMLERPGDGPRWLIQSSSGGHPLPIIVRRSGATEILGEPGTLIGVFADVRFRVGSAQLDEGDVVVLYTDGLTDVPPPYDLDVGAVEAIATKAAEAARAETVEVLADRIHDEIDQLLPIDDRQDDIAVLVIRIES